MGEHPGRLGGASGLWPMWINGAPAAAASGETILVVCPSDGLVFAEVPRGGAKEVDLAVAAARAAFETSWGTMPPVERGRRLARFGRLVELHAGELGVLESRDTGKPLRQGRADMTALARYFEFYAGAADKLMGDTIPLPSNFTAMTFREPHGVVGSIVPWNYPAQIFGRVAGAALAVGNTLVVKPAEDASLTILRLAELAAEAHFPPGVINVVTGYGAEAGAVLAGHPGLDHVTFTGSPEVGSRIQAAAASNRIGCTLELGGKSPQIVFADADLDKALPVLVNAIIQNAGQTCSAGSRILVERAAWDAVTGRLAERFAALVAGPHDADLDLGPLVSARQRDRVAGFVARAEADGVPVLARGRIAPDAPAGGFFHPAILFGPVPEDHEIAREEVFGPVLSILPFDDEAEALRLAGATDYGLVAGIWTRDGARAMRLARRIRSGQVFVNCYGAGGGVELPFGGFGKSGHGREKGFEALYEFTATKTIVLDHG